MEKIDILFATIAMREIEFFCAAANILKEKYDLRVGFINFYEAGNTFIRKRGYKVFDFQEDYRKLSDKDLVKCDSIETIETKHGISFNKYIIHESLTFDRHDKTLLEAKTRKYFYLFERYLEEANCQMVAQELGGFLAPMSLYYTSRKLKIDHIFFEPSFFVDRMHLVTNELNNVIEGHAATEFADATIQSVKNILAHYHKAKPKLSGAKDKHHFKDATLSKFVNKRQGAKLWLKLVNKYFRGNQEEYDAIFYYCWRHIKMYLNRRRNGELYTRLEELNPDRKYVYYPFHVPLDFALTVRASDYLNQIALVSTLAKLLPTNTSLLIKEHPAAIGAYQRKEIKDLLDLGNIVLLSPLESSYDVISAASAVFTINSKVGMEALIQNKPVFTLGSSFYRHQGLTVDLGRPEDIELYFDLLSGRGEDRNHNQQSVERFLCRLMESSFRGELYVDEPENITEFSESVFKKYEDLQHCAE